MGGAPLTICPDAEMIHDHPALTEAGSLARGATGSAQLAKWMHHEGARFFHS